MPSCIVPPFRRRQSYAKYGRTIEVNGATTIAGAVRRRAAPALVILALLGFIGLGLPEGALGVVWPSMRATFGRPVSELGVLLAAFTAGYLVASVDDRPPDPRPWAPGGCSPRARPSLPPGSPPTPSARCGRV